MSRRLVGAALSAVLAVAAGVTAAADVPTVSVQKLIFESPQLDLVGKGRAITYRYHHKVSNERLLGTEYSDDIRLNVLKVDALGKRDVDLQIFFGDRARNRWSETGLTINPVFGWYLNNAVEKFQQMAQTGEFSYLKTRFSKSFLDNKGLDPVKITYDGKEIDAYKLTLKPYAKDPNARGMQGYEVSTFTAVFSPEVPGYFYELVANIESRLPNTPKMVETLTLLNVGDME